MKISENTHLYSLYKTYTDSFNFNLIADDGVGGKFVVDKICITCNRPAELKHNHSNNHSYVKKFVSHDKKLYDYG